jgi:hypothetical protein
MDAPPGVLADVVAITMAIKASTKAAIIRMPLPA